jgi:hypothetical protein
VHMWRASTAICHSGPSDRPTESISTVHPRSFFFLGATVFLFAPDILASRSMTGGAEFSGSSGQRAMVFPLAHPLAHPLASDGWGRSYFCKKNRKIPKRDKTPPSNPVRPQPPPNPVSPPTLANPAAAAAAAQARSGARTARGGGGCGRREEAAGGGGVEQARAGGSRGAGIEQAAQARAWAGARLGGVRRGRGGGEEEGDHGAVPAEHRPGCRAGGRCP